MGHDMQRGTREHDLEHTRLSSGTKARLQVIVSRVLLLQAVRCLIIWPWHPEAKNFLSTKTRVLFNCIKFINVEENDLFLDLLLEALAALLGDCIISLETVNESRCDTAF